MTARVEQLIDLLPEAEVDVMLVSQLVNVRYLTGFTGSNGLVLAGPRTRQFITDFRYVEQSAEEVPPSFERRRAPTELIEAVADGLPSGPLRLGFEASHVSVRAYGRLRELLPERIELVPAPPLVERLRAVKDPDELELIRAAAHAADEALTSTLADGLIGRTEREVAIALETALRVHGADRPGFDPIVAAGPHGALPHAQPSGTEIQSGDVVVIDWGAELGGYRSDCTRTVAAGEPSEEAREVYAVVLAAQLAGLAAVGPGQDGRDVDAAARDRIEGGGYGEHFGHGLGHGVGLDIHESPRLSQRSDDVLVTGNVVTIEPGIYLPGRFGVRIEDLVAVADAGADILTGMTKELIVTS